MHTIRAERVGKQSMLDITKNRGNKTHFIIKKFKDTTSTVYYVHVNRKLNILTDRCYVVDYSVQ